jgi:hypothetical protein
MYRWLALAALAALLVAAPLHAAGITGQYAEARTCDVWTGPCFANAEMNLTGKQAVMAWKVDKGALDDVRLDGLGVVAVVVASDTLGLKQTGSARAVLIVDSKADTAQRAALIRLARQQGGDLVRNVVAVQTAPVDLTLCDCKGNACARLRAGAARLETRCLDDKHDKACGNESAFYPPLAKGVKAKAAVAVEHGYTGKGFNETWQEADRRGAYVGSFEIR